MKFSLSHDYFFSLDVTSIKDILKFTNPVLIDLFDHKSY